MTATAGRVEALPDAGDGPRPDDDVRRVPVVPALLVGVVLLVAGMTISSTVGPTRLGDREILEAVWTRLTVGLEPLGLPERLVTETRLPRIFLAAVIGSTLAVVGCVLQALVRNPLADPAILGGSAGASLGAVAVIVLGAGGLVGLSVGAFIGSALGFGLTLLLAWRAGGVSPLRLVLAGVAVSYLLGALTQVVVLRAGDERKLRSALFWQLGSVADARWDDLALPVVALTAGVVLLVVRARRLDLLSFGDLTAQALGVSPGRLRLEMFVVTSLLTGIAVALAGGIGFVALVVPHAVRLLCGPRHAVLVPVSAVVGAAFLVWADLAARTLAPPSDVPLGVVTALVGAPVFALVVGGRMRDERS